MYRSRRCFLRIPLELAVDYDGEEYMLPDRLLNLSASGAFLRTRRPYESDAAVDISFTLPDLPGTRVRARARVVWSPRWVERGSGRRHPEGVGIAFESLGDGTAHVIDQYANVTTGLRLIDKRIGTELPRHIWNQLPRPEIAASEISLSEIERTVTF